MLTLEEVTYKKVLRGVHLHLKEGLLYSLFGKNGAGKTTLLKVILKIWPSHQGRICWNGRDLKNLTRRELSLIYTLVPQGGGASFPFTIEEFVMMGRYSFFEKESDVTSYLEMVDLLHLKDKRIDQVSLGERQKAYIARGLATDSPLLLLDEPTAHLDSENQLHIWDLLRDLSRKGKTILTATHDQYLAKKFSDHIFSLQDGVLTSIDNTF